MMPELSIADFPDFFRAVTGNAPFPWQVRLAEQVATEGWPAGLSLPTASGKTACIEIAAFTLALQAERPTSERTAPRRIFFVVDRRLVVDAAFQHAGLLAEKLREASDPVIRRVAERLRALGGEALPLGVERLRGGMRRENAWSRSPAQPAVITCTVDQVGSRLLFRSYDGSGYMAPVHAGLAGNDALILLDEAHCSHPFMETARAVELFRGWADEPTATPFRLIILSATPPVEAGTPFKLDEADRNTQVLRDRLQAHKPAELCVAKGANLKRDATSEDRSNATRALAAEMVSHARRLQQEGRRRVALIVNRVATAEEAAAMLREEIGPEEAYVVLMTGRMRPLDRDELASRWTPVLQAAKPEEVDRSVFVVATQCLEVGADFDFDGMVTECASLDALRQRFGRVDRLGGNGHARGVIVVRKDQVKSSDDDPVYGACLAETWHWLMEQAVDGAIDMGIEPLDALLPADDVERANLLVSLSPRPMNAPVMLPAHVDRWVQTDPIPLPDPEPAIFLHGSDRATPEVHVLWRADLQPPAQGDEDTTGALLNVWTATVSLCPPTTVEAVSIPLYMARQWMRAGSADPEQELSDVEGARPPEDGQAARRIGRRVVLVWHGRDKSRIAEKPGDLHPGDFIVIPAKLGHAGLGHLPAGPGGAPRLDVADESHQVARDCAILRLSPEVTNAWPDTPTLARLRAWATERGRLDAPGDLDENLTEVAADHELPDWIRIAANGLQSASRRKLLEHPAGGYVLAGVRRLGIHTSEAYPFADADDAYSSAPGPVALEAHLAGVADTVQEMAERCGLDPALQHDLVLAARLHDAGKADERFQILLHGGSELRWARADEPLAKSAGMPESRAAYLRAREQSGLPAGFRHELLSVRLAESAEEWLNDSNDPELVLHLIASHHGRCRPFAPVVDDPEPVESELVLNGRVLRSCSDTGLERLDSGVAERFWRLVRRYGWWGLAHLEALLRLADHRRSEQEARDVKSLSAGG